MEVGIQMIVTIKQTPKQINIPSIQFSKVKLGFD